MPVIGSLLAPLLGLSLFARLLRLGEGPSPCRPPTPSMDGPDRPAERGIQDPRTAIRALGDIAVGPGGKVVGVVELLPSRRHAAGPHGPRPGFRFLTFLKKTIFALFIGLAETMSKSRRRATSVGAARRCRHRRRTSLGRGRRILSTPNRVCTNRRQHSAGDRDTNPTAAGNASSREQYRPR